MTAVWYIGRADSRTITIADWASIGVTALADTIWSSANGWSIPKTDFNVDQINFLDNYPLDFNVDAPDGPRPPGAVVTGDNKPVTLADLYNLGLLGVPLTFEQYGAVGDGVTDDTVALKDAAAAAAGKVLLGKPGATYRITGTVTVGVADCIVDFRGATVAGDSAGVYATENSLINITGARTTVMNATVTTGTIPNATLRVDAVADSGYENIRFIGNGSAACRFLAFNSDRAFIRRCNITGAMVYLNQTRDSSVEHNLIKDSGLGAVGTGDNNAISVTSVGISTRHNKVFGNIIKNAARCGIEVYDGSATPRPLSDTLVAYNFIEGTETTAISAMAKNSQVVSNVIKDGGTINGWGIEVSASVGTIVRDNILHNCGRGVSTYSIVGIQSGTAHNDPDALGLLVAGNRIYDAWSGIQITAGAGQGSAGIVVENNMIYDPAREGIGFTGSNDTLHTIYRGNTIWYATPNTGQRAGLVIYSQTGVQIAEGNYIHFAASTAGGVATDFGSYLSEVSTKILRGNVFDGGGRSIQCWVSSSAIQTTKLVRFEGNKYLNGAFRSTRWDLGGDRLGGVGYDSDVAGRINENGVFRLSGAGAPALAAPNGSIYQRTDGTGATDTLYVRAAGAWTALS